MQIETRERMLRTQVWFGESKDVMHDFLGLILEGLGHVWWEPKDKKIRLGCVWLFVILVVILVCWRLVIQIRAWD